MVSDDSFLFGPLGCVSFSLWAIKRIRTDNPMDNSERVIRGHKEKDRQPNGQKREGSSEAIKTRTDNPMDKRERGHQRPCLSLFSLWPLMTTFSFVHWVVCPSLYGL
jgi:hypothetical protein